MEIRLIFFKEIVRVISLKTGLTHQYSKHVRAREEKSPGRFFLPKVSLISILQNFTCENTKLTEQPKRYCTRTRRRQQEAARSGR